MADNGVLREYIVGILLKLQQDPGNAQAISQAKETLTSLKDSLADLTKSEQQAYTQLQAVFDTTQLQAYTDLLKQAQTAFDKLGQSGAGQANPFNAAPTGSTAGSAAGAGAQQQASQANQAYTQSSQQAAAAAQAQASAQAQAAQSAQAQASATNQASAANQQATGSFSGMLPQLNQAQILWGNINGQLGTFTKGVLLGAAGASIIGGAALAAGREVGRAFDDAIRSSQQLKDAIGDVQAVVSQPIDQNSLFHQITDLETQVAESGPDLAQSLVSVDQAFQVTQEQSLAMTKAIAEGAQGNRQNISQWTTASIADMQAYNQTADQVTEVQNAQTIALDNTAASHKIFTENLAKLSEAAASNNVTQNENLAIMAAVSEAGGNYSKNLTGIAQAYERLNNTKVQQTLEAQGIAFRDAQQNALPFIDILTELKTKLDSLPDAAARSQFLQQAFGSRGTADAVQALLDHLGTVDKTLTDIGNHTDSDAQKFDQWGNSAAGAADRTKAHLEAIKTTLGDIAQDALPWVFHQFELAAGGAEKLGRALRGESLVQPGDDPNVVAGATGGPGPSDPNFVGPRNTFTPLTNTPPQFAGGTGMTPFEPGNGADQAAAATKKADDAYNKWVDDVLTGSNKTKASLSGTTSDFQALYAQVQKLAAGGNNDQLQSQLEAYAQQLDNLKNEVLLDNQNEAQSSGIFAKYWEFRASTAKQQIQNIIGDVNALIEKENEAADTQSNLNQVANLQSQAQNPDLINSVVQLKKAQDDYNNSVEQGEKAAGLITQTTREKAAQTAAEKAKELPLQQDANDLQKKFAQLQQDDADKMDVLKGKQQDINAKLADANLALYQTTKYYDDLIKSAEKQVKTDTRAEHEEIGDQIAGNFTGPAKQLQDDQKALSEYTRKANDDLHKQEDALYELDKQARETTDTIITGFDAAGNAIRKSVLEPQYVKDLRDKYGADQADANVAQAQAGLDNVGKHLAYLEQGYADLAYASKKAWEQIADDETNSVKPLQKEVQAIQDVESAMQHAQEVAMRAPEDRIYALQQRMQGAQDILSGLQGKMRDLQALDAQAQAEQTRLGQQTGIENLQGRLVNATGANRADLQNQLEQQQASYQRGLQEDALQVQIDKQQKVVDGINAQITAQQRLEAQMNHAYQLQKRVEDDALYNDNLELTRQTRRIQDEKEKQTAIDETNKRAQENDERQASLDTRYLKEVLDWATEADTAVNNSINNDTIAWQAKHNQVTNAHQDDAHYFGDHEYNMGQMVLNDKDAIDKIKAKWDEKIGKENDDLNKLKDVATQEEDTKQAAVDAITKPGGTKWAIDQEITKEGERATAAEQAAQRQVKAITGAGGTLTALQQEYSYLVAIQGINEALAKAGPPMVTPPPAGPPPPATVPGSSTYPGTSANPPPAFHKQTVTGGFEDGGYMRITPLSTQRVPAAPTPVGVGAGLTINGNLNVTTPIPATRSEVNDFADLVFSRAQQRWGRR